MAKFTLPLNSIVKKGKTYSDINKSENMMTVEVYRYNPDNKSNPYTDTYLLKQRKLWSYGIGCFNLYKEQNRFNINI